jgi:hypothetical protein
MRSGRRSAKSDRIDLRQPGVEEEPMITGREVGLKYFPHYRGRVVGILEPHPDDKSADPHARLEVRWDETLHPGDPRVTAVRFDRLITADGRDW